MLIRRCWIAVALLSVCELAVADEIRVAVASNFATTSEAIAQRFEEITDHTIILVFGSTGKHYAQIRNGAPFEVFFAADARRPEMLESAGLTVRESRFTYAIGRLVLWSPEEDSVDTEGRILDSGDFRHLAIANPELAPYGRAAQEMLQSRGLWASLERRLVRGENIGQAFQFVKSGNAELGLVALSQLTSPERESAAGSRWVVPETLHSPIQQQAVLLADTAAARSFLEFIKSSEARSIIRSHGYQTP
ncbi:MAG: molybdate ABC transporter substrate-binding protein [Thermoanaerobaculia bacterium]